MVTKDANSGSFVEARFLSRKDRPIESEFCGYSPTVQYDLEGLSVLYCIVQHSGFYCYLPEQN